MEAKEAKQHGDGKPEDVKPGDVKPEEVKTEKEGADSDEVELPRDELLLSANALAVLVFEVSVIAIVVAYILITAPARSPFSELIEPCLNLSCFQLDQELYTSMNLSVDPCSNFYEYTCGLWGEQHKGFANQFDLLEAKVSNFVKYRIMKEEARLAAGGPFYGSDRTAADYLSCVDVYRKQGDMSSMIKELVFSKLAADFADKKKLVPSTAQETLRLLAHLSLDWNLGILPDFMITRFPDHAEQQQQTENKVIMHLDYSNTVPLWKMQKKKFFAPETLTQCFRDFWGLISTSDVDEHKLGLLLMMDVRVTTTWSLAVSSVKKPKNIHVKEIPSSKLKAEEWLSAINKRLPQDAQLTDDSDLYVSDIGLFAHAEELLEAGEAEDMETLYTLIKFHVARLLAPFTSYKLLQSALGNPPNDTAASQIVTKQCVTAIDQLFPYAWPVLLFGENITIEKLANAKQMYDGLMDATNTALSWLSDEDQKASKARLDSLVPIIGWPDNLHDPNELSMLCPPSKDKYTAFIGCYLASLEAFNDKRKAELASGQVSPPPANDSAGLRAFEVTAVYTPWRGTLYIPPAILFEPFYIEASLAFTWGALGHVLTHELWHAVFGDFTLGVSLATDVVVSATRYKKHECFSKVVEEAGGTANTAEYSAPEGFADIAGLQTAQSSFANSIGATKNGANGTAGFTPEQLFYIGSCFKWCADNGDAHPLSSELNTKPHVRCNAAIMMVAGFDEAFGCSVDSPMMKMRKAKRFCNESDSGNHVSTQTIK
ncbi:endothelin-converting enzyme 2-like [Rhipicephalus microplus]|uniref:endothelin-converting enzyme 2-like n=1 Tax=Rhipicephalus microplus TaxID=6941 RepID=UPI0023765329